MTLLGGLVTLDELGQRGLWRLLMVTPVSLFSTYLMVPHRWDTRKSRRILAAAYGILHVNFLLTHLSILPQPLTGELGSVLKGLLEYLAYPFILSKYRDWRTIFLLLTIGAVSVQADALAVLFYLDGSPDWTISLLTAGMFGLSLAYFVRFQRGAIWQSMEYDAEGWATLSAFPAMACIVLLLFRLFPGPLSIDPANQLGIITMALLLPIFYRALFRTLANQRERAHLEQSAALFQAQVQMVEAHTERMERRIHDEALARHEQRHFMQILLAHLDADDADGARAEIRAKLTRGEKSKASYCKDPVLNQLLDYYAQWAEKEGIHISIRADIPEAVPHRRTEIMIALCNILENAIHACMLVPSPGRRRIGVILWNFGKQFYIEVCNNYTGELTLDPSTGIPCSTRSGHGYGLQGVAAIAGKRPEWTAKDGVFRISVLI